MRGTPEQFLDAVEQRIAELGGSDELIASATNTCNVDVAATTSELTSAQIDDLWNIADSFVSSNPVSGDWETETAAEQQYIAEHFDCSLDQAKEYMVNYLGFDPTDKFIGSDAEVTADANPDHAVEITYDVVEASEDIDDYDEYEDLTEWEEIASRTVTDIDGFTTDYTLWHNTYTDEWICIFGDNDIYNPATSDADAEFDSEDEAREWFDSYEGLDYDDILDTTAITASSLPAGKGRRLLNTAKKGADIADQLDSYLDVLNKLNQEEVQIADYISTSEIQQLQEIPDLLREIYRLIKEDVEPSSED